MVDNLRWSTGNLPNFPPVIPLLNQQAIDFSLVGKPIVKSNNPEKIVSEGWLTHHSFTDSQRGGALTYLTEFRLYLSHLNGTAKPLYVQVILVNPQKRPLTVTYQGSVLTSAEVGDNNGVVGESNYYQVSENLLGFLKVTTITILPGGATQVTVKRLNPSGSVDGLFFINATPPGLFSYVVATVGETLVEALALAHTPATRTPAKGNIKRPSNRAFGTESGVYATSQVESDVVLYLPEQPSYIGLSVNYAGYEIEPTSPFVQTAPPLLNGLGEALRLSDSAYRTQGNYGHEYLINLTFVNSLSQLRRVRMWFGSNAFQANRQLLYNGAVSIKQEGNEEIKRVLTTPKNPKQVLREFLLASQTEQTLTLRFFIPGLSSANLQLIVEVIN